METPPCAARRRHRGHRVGVAEAGPPPGDVWPPKLAVPASIDRAGYLALRTIEDLGPLSTKALATALNLDASTVTRQIAALETAASSIDVRTRMTGDRPRSS